MSAWLLVVRATQGFLTADTDDGMDSSMLTQKEEESQTIHCSGLEYLWR